MQYTYLFLRFGKTFQCWNYREISSTKMLVDCDDGFSSLKMFWKLFHKTLLTQAGKLVYLVEWDGC